MTRLLIVDDSALMRKHLTTLFGEEGGFELAIARNGVEALERVRDFRPDVVTLDINMPDMDGLTALSRIMTESPVPVVMVSSLTEKGAMATLEAMAMGAVDYIPKPGGTISLSLEQIRAELVRKVKAAAGAKVRSSQGLTARLRRERASAEQVRSVPRASGAANGVVLIGVSTGGPRTLEDILPALPGDFPLPVVVAQHMPESFTAALARRMNGLCALSVVEVDRPLPLEAGTVYIGRGDTDVVLARRPKGIVAMPRPATARRLWHPSADELVYSALEYFPAERIIGVLLTGMGYDGAEAMAQLHQRGGLTLAEDESTAVVFGMPAELIKRGGAGKVLPADKVAGQLNRWARRPE